MDKDEIALCIEAFDEANGGGVGWYRDKGAYHLFLLTTEAPIARLKPTGTGDEFRDRLLVTPAKMERHRRHGRLRLAPRSGP